MGAEVIDVTNADTARRTVWDHRGLDGQELGI